MDKERLNQANEIQAKIECARRYIQTIHDDKTCTMWLFHDDLRIAIHKAANKYIKEKENELKEL